MASAMALSALSLSSVEAKPSGREAARALRPISFMRASMSAAAATLSSMGFVLRLHICCHDQIITMDHCGAAGIAEDGLDLRRLAAGDLARLVRIVAGEASGDLPS